VRVIHLLSGGEGKRRERERERCLFVEEFESGLKRVWKELDCVALQRWRELQSSTRSKGEGLKEARVRKEKRRKGSNINNRN